MGALVGGLYAADPNGDLKANYGALMRSYADQTRKEAQDAAGLGFFLLGGLAIQSGAAAGDALLAGAAGAGLGLSSIREIDQKRLVKVLETSLAAKTIPDLPIQFATWHVEFQLELVRVTVTSGSAAAAIGHSVANPFIFTDVKVRPGARLDPGIDRVSAIPLEDACKLRPDAHFVVSNVTDQAVYG
jgi:NTE family protein